MLNLALAVSSYVVVEKSLFVLLCSFLVLDVRLSSNGLLSGGNLTIFLNKLKSATLRPNEMMNHNAPREKSRKLENRRIFRL